MMPVDYDRYFSDDVPSFVSSPTREIFKKVDINAIYSLAGGYPDPATYPLDKYGEIMADVIARYGAKAFQYGGTQGVPELRNVLSSRYGQPLERIQITTSSQQGIDVCGRVFLNPGDVVLCSNPTYLGALQSFLSYRAELVGVSHRSGLSGFRQAYEDAILSVRAAGKRVKLMYMIPDFQNPSGETLTAEERRCLVSLAERYDFLIVEDCPYKELRYEGEDEPSMYSMCPERVIHLGSFSKIMSPGFRLGWIFAAPEIIHQIYVCKQALDLCPPVFDQYVAAGYMASGALDANLQKVRALYREKRDIMLEELAAGMPEGVSWTRPQGGLFLFLTLPDHFDCVALYDKALSAGVAYVSGNMFFTDFASGAGRNTMRLNFSFLPTGRLREGVRLLCRLVREELGAPCGGDSGKPLRGNPS